MNLNDAFGEVVVRPHPKWTLRPTVHALSLANRHDLWYVGGGAFQDEPSFGYTGRPSHNRLGLALLTDGSVDYTAGKNTILSGYLGYAAGGDVIRSIYGNGRGLYGYVEANQKW